MKESTPAKSTLTYALLGAGIGLLFPTVAFLLVYLAGVGTGPLLVIILLAIPVLGATGWLVGAREQRLRGLADDLEEQVTERTAAIRSMLDVTGDGFLTFGPDYRVNPEYSRACEEIFDGPVAGRKLPELLYSDEKQREEFTDGLDLYFSGRAKPDVIFDLLDKRLDIGDRVIRVDFRAIDDATVMCALSDITEEERLEATLEDQNRRRDLILRVVSNRKFFASFIEEANNLFEVLDAISAHRSSQIPQETAERLAAQVHTFKGNASFLGFSRTAMVAHDFEDQLAALPILEHDLDLSSEVFVIKRQYYEEYNVISDTLGEQWINDLATISIPIGMVRKVEQYARQKHASDPRLISALERLRSVRFVDLFSRYPQLIEDVARRRARRIGPVEIYGGEFRVLPDRYEPLVNALTHIARNMVDHGIESPAEREMKGKLVEGQIRLDIARDNGEITITFSDDGRGISFPAVEERARAKGLISSDATPSRQELLALLFSSGFSTAEEITAVSGRGVGLNAVQQEVRRLGGRIAVETRPGRGTTFRIVIPERPRVASGGRG